MRLYFWQHVAIHKIKGINVTLGGGGGGGGGLYFQGQIQAFWIGGVAGL